MLNLTGTAAFWGGFNPPMLTNSRLTVNGIVPATACSEHWSLQPELQLLLSSLPANNERLRNPHECN
jgi:hypothetical protein